MPELPQDPIEKLIQRAHNHTHGAPPSFKGRLRARMAAEATVQKQTRMAYIKVAVAVAAALVIALVVSLNIDLFLPSRVQTPPPQAKDEPALPEDNSIEQPGPSDDNTPEQPVPAPTPEPEPKPDETIEKPQPTPEPEPEPEQPEDTVEKPNPEPEPKHPEETPEDVIEKPEPVQPGDTVKKPEPTQPEETKPVPSPADRVTVATLMSNDAKLEFRYDEQEWRKPEPGEIFYSGVQFKTGRSPVDVKLNGGAFARFDGELSLTKDLETYTFELTDDTLYVDNLALGAPVRAVANGIEAVMDDGVGVFYAVRNGHEVACLAGGITLGGTPVDPLTIRKASDRGVSDAKAWKGDRFLRNLPERLLSREDFETEPPGGMYRDGERLEDGVAVMDKAPRYIAFRHNPTLEVLPGMVVRVRLRTKNVSRLELELFTQTEIDLLKKNPQEMFKHIWKPEKNGDWFEIELRVEDIADNEDAEHFPEHGDLLRNFKLHFVGDKLEIDRVEFVRIQD